MNPHILAIRALASTLARNILLPIIIAAAIIFALIIILLLWIADAIGSWLLLLIIPVAFTGIIIGIALFIIYRTVRSIQPKNMSKDQKVATKEFISHLETYAELKGTPKFLIVWKIIMSALKKSPREYMSSLIGESTKLKSSYSNLIVAFGGTTPGRKKVRNLEEK